MLINKNMKNFRVTITDGSYTEIKAKSEKDLLSKLSARKYGIMPRKGKNQVINSENISKIEEIVG